MHSAYGKTDLFPKGGRGSEWGKRPQQDKGRLRKGLSAEQERREKQAGKQSTRKDPGRLMRDWGFDICTGRAQDHVHVHIIFHPDGTDSLEDGLFTSLFTGQHPHFCLPVKLYAFVRTSAHLKSRSRRWTKILVGQVVALCDITDFKIYLWWQGFYGEWGKQKKQRVGWQTEYGAFYKSVVKGFFSLCTFG